jgi:rhodanese-related sulfurtransferase
VAFFSKPAYQTLSPQQIAAMLDADQIHLVDVRESHEWAQGHIPGAIHVPLSDLASRFSSVPKDKPVVLYCLAGGRSDQAARWCTSHGFAIEAHMGGGISAWRMHGLPVVTD